VRRVPDYGPLVEDHYKLELPWLPWLRTDGRSWSPKVRRGTPTRNGQPSIAFDFTTDSIHLDCYAYATLLPPPFSSHSSLRQCAQPSLGFASLLNIAFMRLLPSCSRFAKDYRRSRVLPTLPVREMCCTVIRSSYHLTWTLAFSFKVFLYLKFDTL